MAKTASQERVKRLTEHLRQENPVLASTVESFQKLDRIARPLGLIDADESLANQVSWWPVISVLGTFSAGKSTFINQYVGSELQRTGNQAVDDKFTVICYGPADSSIALPGLALDSDPRFPFYQIGHEIAEVADSESRGVDSYLQLKTSSSENMRGKIVIDSPGFDADKQRTSTLLITKHIIDLSDLVLVFFDARHPEPGAMMDTLQHLVSETVNRPDATKFLYVLNQMDNAARDDNSEEVVAAWQRALAQHGLTAGRFYGTYARDVAVPVEDEQVRERLERKRDEDLNDIQERIQLVEVERAYRVAGVLEQTARRVDTELMPALESARRSWRRRSLWLQTGVIALLAALFMGFTIRAGLWSGFKFTPLSDLPMEGKLVAGGVVLIFIWLICLKLRGIAGNRVLKNILKDEDLGKNREPVAKAFSHNMKAWWQLWISPTPRNWNSRRKRQLQGILAEADGHVQALNDQYANPSGKGS